MSELLNQALQALKAKVDGGFDSAVKFDFEGEGALRLDENGAAIDDGSDADCTITASADVFREMFEGTLDPTSAFMSGKLKIDGDMGAAMKLASILG